MKHLANSRGLTLLETLGGIALTAAVAMGLLFWVNFYERGVTSMNQIEAVNNSMTHVMAAFGGDDQYCTAILGGTTLIAAENSYGTVNAINYYNLSGVEQGNVIKRGQKVEKKSDVIVSDIRLVPITVVSGNDIFANLEITFHKERQTLGANDLVRRIPVYATVASGKVQTCSTSLSTLMVIKNRICEVKSDGYSHYDEITGKCKDNENVKWFYGSDAFSASCPTGYHPAVSKFRNDPASIACEAETQFSDTTLPARNYSDGGIDDAEFAIWKATPDGLPISACKFAYDSQVPLGGSRGKIKCAVN